MAEVLLEPRAVDGETARLYAHHGDRIYRFCLSRLRSREEAEDAVQSTFLRAHGALRQGVVPYAEAAWLFKIARNVCLSRAVASSRRTKLEHAVDLEQVHERVPDAPRQHDELIGLADALAEMPPNLRRPFLLREWKGLSYKEIAEELGVSQSAVETLIFRARRHLAGALDSTGGPLRRALKALNLGPILEAVRPLLAGGGAKVAAVAAVATVGAVGVVTVPGSQVRSPDRPRGVTPSGQATPGILPATGASGAAEPTGRVRLRGRPAATARSGSKTRTSGNLGTTPWPSAPTARPASSAAGQGNPVGPATAAAPTTGAVSPNSPAPPPSDTGSTSAQPSGSSGPSGTPPIVATPPALPVNPPSPPANPGLPEVPLPVPVPAVPAVPAVPSPSVPPPPSLTTPPVPVTPPSVPPVPQPPPIPEVPPLPPPPQILPPPPPPPPFP